MYSPWRTKTVGFNKCREVKVSFKKHSFLISKSKIPSAVPSISQFSLMGAMLLMGTLMPFANVSSSVFNMNPSDQANNTPNAYIKRIYYPSSEYTVNEANVKEAEKRMGGSNSIQNNLWWDVN